MQRHLIWWLVVSLFTVLAVAQKPPTHTEKPGSATKASQPAEANNSVSLPSEETVNAFMKETFGYDPSVSWKIIDIKPSQAAGLAEVSVMLSNPQGQQATTFYVTPDGMHAVIGEIIPFGAHPFLPAKEKLEKSVFGPSKGATNAPAMLVEFSDLQCPHCKAAQPIVDKLVSEEPTLRLVFQNFPLPSHDWAGKAAAYADCIGRTSNDAFWKFIAGVYDAQGEITATNADEKLKAIATAAGGNGAQAATCADQAETVGRVERSTALGRSLGVNSTPTLFLNGRKIGSITAMPYDMLKKLVESAEKEGK